MKVKTHRTMNQSEYNIQKPKNNAKTSIVNSMFTNHKWGTRISAGLLRGSNPCRSASEALQATRLLSRSSKHRKSTRPQKKSFMKQYIETNLGESSGKLIVFCDALKPMLTGASKFGAQIDNISEAANKDTTAAAPVSKRRKV